MAFSSVKKAFTSRPSYAGDPNADFLAEACRKATAKDTYRPDENMKELIASKINESTVGAVVPVKVSHDILRRRLQMENPHKQWLAVDLVRHVLGACEERMRPYRADLLLEVARVAAKPNKRGSLAAQQSARRTAIDFLHQSGAEGVNALRMVRATSGSHMSHGFQGMMGMPYQTVPNNALMSGPASGSPQRGSATTLGNVQQPTGDVIVDVKALIDTANSHSALLQDLILAQSSDITPNQSRGDMNPIVADLKVEIAQLKDRFPAALEALSQVNSAEAEALMAKALEAMDVLDSCLELETQVAGAVSPPVVSPAAATLSDNAVSADADAVGGPPPVATEGGDAASPAAATPAAAAPPPADPFDLLSFDASLRTPTASAKLPAVDPFGLSDLAADGPPAASAAPLAVAADRLNQDDPFLAEAPPSSAAPPAPAGAPASSNPFSGAAGSSNNPFGGAAFGADAASQAAASAGALAPQPGPGMYPPQQFGGVPPQGPYSAQVTGYGPPPGYSAAYSMPPPMYSAQPSGFGAPPTGFGGAPPGAQMSGPQVSAQPSGWGQPAGANPFGSSAYGGSVNPFALGPPAAAPAYGSSATGMPAPGYAPQPMANPFAMPATGAGGRAWNPNAHNDAFNDLVSQHNKYTNPQPPMSAPMRQSGGHHAPPQGVAGAPGSVPVPHNAFGGGNDTFEALVASKGASQGQAQAASVAQ